MQKKTLSVEETAIQLKPTDNRSPPSFGKMTQQFNIVHSYIELPSNPIHSPCPKCYKGLDVSSQIVCGWVSDTVSANQCLV